MVWWGRQPLLAGLVAAILVGCIPPPPAPPAAEAPAPPVPEPTPPAPEAPAATPRTRVSDTERLLYYYEYLLGLNPEQVAREGERTQRFFSQHRSEFALMQLVLLRILPAAGPKDRAQAQDLLTQFLKESRERGSELRPFALLLNNLLSEQQRLETDLQAQAQKIKDDARRYDELKQKLDALIETERKMLERTKPTRTQ
jgi:hypothetical protein